MWLCRSSPCTKETEEHAQELHEHEQSLAEPAHEEVQEEKEVVKGLAYTAYECNSWEATFQQTGELVDLTSLR